jgi:predicted transposase YdaD
MNRPTFADPKTDFVFKRIFGSEQHKDVLVAFLNDMLGLDQAHRIVRVELLSPEQRPAVAELKLSIVDVKCTDVRGVIQNERGALAVAENRGEQRGEQRGREAGLRQGIEALCGALGVELTDARRRELANLDVAGLETLLARLSEHKRWS